MTWDDYIFGGQSKWEVVGTSYQQLYMVLSERPGAARSGP